MSNDIVNSLREMADEIERQSLLEIKTDMTIGDAWRALAGFKHVKLEVSIERTKWDKETQIQFEIYDGTTTFRSKSLQECLRKMLEAHPANATMEKIEEMFDGKKVTT